MNHPNRIANRKKHCDSCTLDTISSRLLNLEFARKRA